MYAGKKLRQLRLKLDKSQDEMAVDLGVSRSYYSAIEIGKRKISKKMIDKIIEIYKIDGGYFSNEKEQNVSNNLGGNIGGVHVGVGIKRAKSKGVKSYDELEIDKLMSIGKQQEIDRQNRWDVIRKEKKYNELLFAELAAENSELIELYNTIKSVIDFEFTLENIENSMVFEIMALFETHYSYRDFSVELPNYKEYKQIRETELAKLLPFAEIFKNLSVAIEIFRKEMQKHGKSINYEDDLMPNEAELPSTDETQASKEL